MSEPENLTLQLLRRIDRKVDTVIDRLDDLTLRVSSLETRQVAVEQSIAHGFGEIGRLDTRLDRMEKRMARIEDRLDIADA